MPIAQFVRMDQSLRPCAPGLDQSDTAGFEAAMQKSSTYRTLHDAARELITRGITDQAEVDRVLGPKE